MTLVDGFEPSRSAALRRFEDFLPRAGRLYALWRNHDRGPDREGAVSGLSPYLRHRSLSEPEILQAVLSRHGAEAGEKFIEEVFWRTYWKGWLERRPEVWEQYLAELAQARDALATQDGLRQRHDDACHGRTGIACFDAWAQEAVATGFLHNHARMWFASIWIFTLRLPWTLGAAFFLRHLLDGDPASNTLSWRWVGGLQTPGKTYLARPENIAKYTEGRFAPAPGELAQEAPPLSGPPLPEMRPAPTVRSFDPDQPTSLVLHSEDLSPGWLIEALSAPPRATAVLMPEQGDTALRVHGFRQALTEDMLTRWQGRLGTLTRVSNAKDLAQWASAQAQTQILTPYAPVGPVRQSLTEASATTDIHPILRGFDAAAWPHASAGFFKFRKAIPDLLVEMRRAQ